MEPQTSDQNTTVTKKRVATLPLLLVGILVVALAYVSLQWWQGRQDLESVQKDLREANDTAQNKTDANNKNSSSGATEISARDKALLAASNYYCSIKDFGCDKVASTASQFQAPTTTSDGFAVITALGPRGNTTNIWLKARVGGSGEWVVIFEGKGLPGDDVTKKFSIPESFLYEQQ